MTFYIFRNKGLIDPLSITTFGVSSKETKNPIGYFGTGLKYAIAVILRLKGEISIRSGSYFYEFKVERTRIRVNDFDMVTMNGSPAGFTTELGKTWEPWQALRELICNTMDESGEWFSTEHQDLVSFSENETSVIVQCPALAEAWSSREEIFLSSHIGQPVIDHSGVEVYRTSSNWLYYRGVRVHKLERRSLLTYNLTAAVDLTEDRTLKYSFLGDSRAAAALKHLDDENLIAEVLMADSQTTYEGALSFSGPFHGAFEKVAMQLAQTRTTGLNSSIEGALRSYAMNKLVTAEQVVLDNIDGKRLHRAVQFLKKLGHAVDRYPIIVTEFLGEGVLGQAHEDKIFLSKRVFLMGTKMLAGTILEEYLHLRHGVKDCERSMQNMLIDMIISMGERQTRMPL